VAAANFDAVDVERLRRRRTVKWSLYGPDVLAAWVAEMDFDVAPVVRAALLDAVDREDFGYVAADLSELTNACAGFLAASYGWTVQPARIFPVADVLTGIAGAFNLFLAPGAGVVVPTPAYPPFFEIVELTGRPAIAAPMLRGPGRDELDLDAIDAALASGAGGVLLCNPHNPTGRVFTARELAALAAVADRHAARVVADEVHAPLVYPDHRHIPYATVSDAAAAHSITVTSASKAFNLAGLKCAQVIATNHDDASRWRALHVHEVAGPTPLGIAASTAAYCDGSAWLHELVGYLDANRRALAQLVAGVIPGVDLHLPQATFLAWLDCAVLGLDDPARFFLDHAHVALSDGPPFGPGCEQFVRLNFATSRALLERVVGAMGEAVQRRGAAG
jgi:cystathionine beta-lyase